MSRRGDDRGRGRGSSGPGSGAGSDGGHRGRGSYRGKLSDGGGPDDPGSVKGSRGSGRGSSRGHWSTGPPRGGFGGHIRQYGRIFAPEQVATIDSRLTDGSQEKVLESLHGVGPPGELPFRPDYGTLGKPIKLRANFFPVTIPKYFYRYDVYISPSENTYLDRVKRRIFQLAERTPDWQRLGLLNSVMHDRSRKLITAKKLRQPIIIRVSYTDKDEDGEGTQAEAFDETTEYILTIDFDMEIDTGELTSYLSGCPDRRNSNVIPILSVVNLFLAAWPNRRESGGVKIGRSRFFFPTKLEPFPIGGGLEACTGFYSSVRPAHNQLMVNVDACTKAFYRPGNLAEALIEFRWPIFNAYPEAFFRRLKVKLTHTGSIEIVQSFNDMNARQTKFKYCNKVVTVEEYAREKYGKPLKYPDLPLVNFVGGQKFFPPEMCEILPGQSSRMLSEGHTANMIRAAVNPPKVNGEMIVNHGLRELGFRQCAAPLGASGINVGTDMAVIPGRILPSPSIKYGKGTPVVDEQASWNLRNVRFAKGATLDNWVVLLIKDGNNGDFSGTDDSQLQGIIKEFTDTCRQRGMLVGNNPPSFLSASLPPKNGRDRLRTEAIAVIRDALRTGSKSKPSLILVILSDHDKSVYSGIKHLCDVFLGVATVCVRVAKMRRGHPYYLANVALKVNMKLGGVNHTLDPANIKFLLDVPTMLVGIDMTHPSDPSNARGTPSIAAVVASVDQQYVHFPASMEIQESKRELVSNLGHMMTERLLAFKARNGTLPQRILVYRDGISEGHIWAVVTNELPEIKCALQKFEAYRPKLTMVIICCKRHHTRFYPTEEANAAPDGNANPGTVVDSGVTTAHHFEFLLQAHAGLRGQNTRPVHYFVVHDEIGFKADELQGLTNSLSYMCARATRAVSVVSPAYYAGLACRRGRCYLHKLLSGLSDHSENEDMVFREAQQVWSNGVSKALQDTMFYL